MNRRRFLGTILGAAVVAPLLSRTRENPYLPGEARARLLIDEHGTVRRVTDWEATQCRLRVAILPYGFGPRYDPEDYAARRRAWEESAILRVTFKQDGTIETRRLSA